MSGKLISNTRNSKSNSLSEDLLVIRKAKKVEDLPPFMEI
jgi:hypothetical protein